MGVLRAGIGGRRFGRIRCVRAALIMRAVLIAGGRALLAGVFVTAVRRTGGGCFAGLGCRAGLLLFLFLLLCGRYADDRAAGGRLRTRGGRGHPGGAAGLQVDGACAVEDEDAAVADGDVQAILLAGLAAGRAVDFLHQEFGATNADGGGGRVQPEVVGVLLADGAGNGTQGTFQQAVEAALFRFAVGVLVDAKAGFGLQRDQRAVAEADLGATVAAGDDHLAGLQPVARVGGTARWRRLSVRDGRRCIAAGIHDAHVAAGHDQTSGDGGRYSGGRGGRRQSAGLRQGGRVAGGHGQHKQRQAKVQQPVAAQRARALAVRRAGARGVRNGSEVCQAFRVNGAQVLRLSVGGGFFMGCGRAEAASGGTQGATGAGVRKRQRLMRKFRQERSRRKA